MHRDFEIKLRTLNNVEKEYTSQEVDYYLNLAERTLFEQILPEYDDDDRIKTILFPLLSSVESTRFSIPTELSDRPKSVVNLLPTNFKVAKGERATITQSTGSIKSVRVKSVSQDYYNLNIENPFKKPCDELVWRLDYPNSVNTTKQHELALGDGCTIQTYFLRYIKELPGMSIFSSTDSSLHTMVHDDLVDRAKNFAIQDLGILNKETK